MEELDGADIEAEVSAPHIRVTHEERKLVVESIEIALPQNTSRVEEALLWTISFPVMQQRLPGGAGVGRGLKCAAAFIYRYVLGINGGPKLPNRLLKKLQGIL